MKAFAIIAKIVVAVAAVAGIIYLAATYGDRVIAWAKKMIAKAKRPKAEFFDDECCEECEECCEAEEAVAEEEFEG